jgi:uncharacterized protein (TIGR02118 family)
MLSRRDFGRTAMAGAVTGTAALAAMASGTAQAAGGSVFSVNVLYPHHPGAKFDHAYYRATHIPMVREIMKPLDVVLVEGVATPAGPAPFVMIAHIQFASLEALQASQTNPRMPELRDDLAKFTDIKPTILIGRTA